MDLLKMLFHCFLFLSISWMTVDSTPDGVILSGQGSEIFRRRVLTQTDGFGWICRMFKNFSFPVNYGNVNVHCMLNESSINKLLGRIRHEENVTEAEMFPALSRATLLLRRSMYTSVCLLKCQQGRTPARLRGFLPHVDSDYSVNVGCEDIGTMTCLDTCIEEDLRNLKGDVACSNKNHDSSTCSLKCWPGYVAKGPTQKICRGKGAGWVPNVPFLCQSLSPTSKSRQECIVKHSNRVTCGNVTSNRSECLDRLCCWDDVEAAPIRCYKPSESQTDTTSLTEKFVKLSNSSNDLSMDVFSSFFNNGTFSDSDSAKSVRKSASIYKGICGCRKNYTPTLCSRGAPPDIVTLPKRKIVNGHIADPYNWPWHAFVYVYHKFCGGTLISDRFVITAGHCLLKQPTDNDDSNFILLNASALDDGSPPQHFGIEAMVTHPGFREQRGEFVNDIGLVKLDRSVDYSTGAVRNLCLPIRVTTSTDECFVTGFGSTDNTNRPARKLHVANLPVADFNRCNKVYGNILDRNTQFCAGKTNVFRPADTCAGDSGGPLACRQRGRNCCDWYLAGVTSFGSSPCGIGRPSVYTNVLHYVQWINSTKRKMNLPKPGTTPTTPKGK